MDVVAASNAQKLSSGIFSGQVGPPEFSIFDAFQHLKIEYRPT
jgi:hypothetical protein